MFVLLTLDSRPGSKSRDLCDCHRSNNSNNSKRSLAFRVCLGVLVGPRCEF